jgi:ribosomal-protein-alanine N-acetyltransferase
LFSHPKVIDSYLEPPLTSKQDLPLFVDQLCSNENKVWVISTKETPIKRIGICALHHWNKETKTIEIGGTLLPAYWGSEIMKECFQQLIQFAYNEFGIDKVIGKTYSENKRAIQLVKKLGFEIQSSAGKELILAKRRELLLNV